MQIAFPQPRDTEAKCGESRVKQRNREVVASLFVVAAGCFALRIRNSFGITLRVRAANIVSSRVTDGRAGKVNLSLQLKISEMLTRD
ncbi:hypothetical protein K0M31_000282, partial [Melipona bicolor]